LIGNPTIKRSSEAAFGLSDDLSLIEKGCWVLTNLRLLGKDKPKLRKNQYQITIFLLKIREYLWK
jgi:hypothetical protein